ncbi:MAG: hypothetical protein ACLPWF_01070 [Bryobacteraceae bacterium]
MLLRLSMIGAVLACLCSADTLTLRSGRVITGQYLGGDARHIRMAVGDHVDTFNVEDVGDIEFSGDSRSAVPSPPPPPPAQAPPPLTAQTQSNPNQGTGFAQQPPPPATPVAGIQIPAGTPITVRMIDAVDSKVARLGQTFRASVDEPVLINGQTVIPRGADALAKLVEDQQSGKFEGKTILTLALTDITINGQMIDTTTGNVSQASGARGARTAKVVGGATALGAIIGALAGGGRGAAIGAASGAAVGGGAEILTKGQQVKIPSETRLSFTLQQPIQF